MTQNDLDANLKIFVDAARNQPHPSILCDSFDDLRWPIACKRKRGRQTFEALVFTVSSARRGEQPEPLPEPFASFARALIQRQVRLTFELGTIDPFRSTMMALRYLFATLSSPTASPTELNSWHFVRAEAAIWAEHSTRAAQNQIYALKHIKEALEALGLTPGKIEWVPDTSNKASDPEIDMLRRRELLVTDEEICALATLSLDPGQNARQRILQRCVDLMICGAFRVGEACTLPLDTLVERPVLDLEGNIVREPSGAPVLRYGLRYWPEKGGRGETLLRPIPTVLAPFAKRAVDEIKMLTETSRRVAKAHYEERSPFEEQPWRDMPQDALLRPDQVASILGLSTYGFDIGRRLIKSNNLPFEWGTYTNAMNRTFQQPFVRKHTIDALAKSLSFTQTCIDAEDRYIPLHECLMIVPYFGRGDHPGYKGTAVAVDSQMVGLYLSSNAESHSAFRRHAMEYCESGQEIRLTPNMMRYWVDTVALKGGLNHFDLARWMGRTKVSVNRSYDLRNDEQKADYLYAEAAATMPKFVEFKAEKRLDGGFESAGHVTSAGLCRTLFAAAPCPNFVQSLYNGKFAAETRNLAAAELGEVFKAIGLLLKSAEEAYADGQYGAAKWLAVQRAALSICEKEFARRGKDLKIASQDEANAA